MKENKKIPGSGGGRIPGRHSIGGLMSFKHFITKDRKMQERFAQIVESAVALYIMFACVWTICYLVGEILQKMGVA